ncbi:hypothetical protein [Gimibacter soli]|uniref:Uncharacterized protein n=1 Tax=Gimibacter soli TaxID=3024400 RepID=A0AAF0BKL1_9PROT|nr:hypothetical protein [Gimibacter soli]WCL54404.1 hypothetical protein PH603_01355 [Gimibacter soli]
MIAISLLAVHFMHAAGVPAWVAGTLAALKFTWFAWQTWVEPWLAAKNLPDHVKEEIAAHNERMAQAKPIEAMAQIVRANAKKEPDFLRSPQASAWLASY